MTALQTLFFLGKGGTGKSTASALLSLVLMEKGKKVLLASFDDAHNQSDIFEDPKKSSLMAVFNQDVLSVAETRRILEQLDSLNITVKGLVCNDRMEQQPEKDDRKHEFLSHPIQRIPYSSFSLIGTSALKQHIRANDLTFEQILN